LSTVRKCQQQSSQTQCHSIRYYASKHGAHFYTTNGANKAFHDELQITVC